MAIDASDILSAWMTGSRFVSQNLQEAEERQQKDEERRMSSLAMRFDAMTSPKIVNGQIQPPDWNAALNDPEMIAFANSDYMKPFRTQGIQGGDFKISGVQPTQDGKFAVVGQRVDEDGNPVSQPGVPITMGRTSDNNDPVFTLDPDSANRFIIGGIARFNPNIAKELHGRQMSRALGVAAMQFNKAKSPEEQQELLNSVGQWFTPDQVIRAASGGLKFKENLATGTLDVESPNGSTTSIPSADIAAKSNQVAGLRAQQNIAAQDAGREAELGFNERTLSRRTGLHNKEVSATVPHDTQVQAQAGLAAAPTVGRAAGVQENTRNATTRPYERQVEAQDSSELNGLLDAAARGDQGAAQQLTRFYKSREAADQAIDAYKARSAGAQVSESLKSDEGALGLMRAYPGATTPTKNRIRLELIQNMRSDDPELAARAAKTYQMLDTVDNPPRPGSAKEPEPGRFDRDAVRQALKPMGMDEEAFARVALDGEQLFRKAASVVRPTKGSQEEVLLNEAVGNALLANRPDHVLPLYTHAILKNDPIYREGAGSPEFFLNDVHQNVLDNSTKRGAKFDDRTLMHVDMTAAGLMSQGVSKPDAINAAINLELNPKAAREIARLVPTNPDGTANVAESFKVLAQVLKTSPGFSGRAWDAFKQKGLPGLAAGSANFPQKPGLGEFNYQGGRP